MGSLGKLGVDLYDALDRATANNVYPFLPILPADSIPELAGDAFLNIATSGAYVATNLFESCNEKLPGPVIKKSNSSVEKPNFNRKRKSIYSYR